MIGVSSLKKEDEMDIKCGNKPCYFFDDLMESNCSKGDEPDVEICPKFKLSVPTVVCLCGSTKFKQEFIGANFRETMAGKIVLSVGWFSHADGKIYTPTASEKVALDQLHFRKIDLADEVLILNVGGYIGESTRNELNYAIASGKQVRFLVGS